MAIVGLDVEAVEQLGNNLQNQGDAIQGVISAVDGLIQNVDSIWKGSDATEFIDWWQSKHRPALLSAMEAINGLGQSAKNNASAQRDVSNV